MRYVFLFLVFFTLGTAMAHKYDVEPKKVYEEIPLKLYKQDGNKFGFEG